MCLLLSFSNPASNCEFLLVKLYFSLLKLCHISVVILMRKRGDTESPNIKAHRRWTIVLSTVYIFTMIMTMMIIMMEMQSKNKSKNFQTFFYFPTFVVVVFSGYNTASLVQYIWRCNYTVNDAISLFFLSLYVLLLFHLMFSACRFFFFFLMIKMTINRSGKLLWFEKASKN